MTTAAFTMHRALTGDTQRLFWTSAIVVGASVPHWLSLAGWVLAPMMLLTATLHDLVPFSSCALFLSSEATGVLHCGYSSGLECDTLQRITFSSGQGLTGWVARTGKPACVPDVSQDSRYILLNPRTRDYDRRR